MENETFYSALERLAHEPKEDWVKYIYEMVWNSNEAKVPCPNPRENESHLTIVLASDIES